MTIVTIKQCTIAELESAPNIGELIDDYAAESAIEGLPHPTAKAETYKALEAAGLLSSFASYEEDELTGFITVLCAELPHYGRQIATVERFFVARNKRKGGAGVKLLHTAETFAREKGSPGLLVSAPFGGVLAAGLEHSASYIETNRVFFKRFT